MISIGNNQNIAKFNKRFNVKQQLWTIVYNGKEVMPRVDHSLVVYKKNLYIFGGCDGQKKFDDFFKFDISLQKMIRVIGDGEPPSARFGHTAEVYRNDMYLFGGWNGTDTLDELYAYSFISNYWY